MKSLATQRTQGRPIAPRVTTASVRRRTWLAEGAAMLVGIGLRGAVGWGGALTAGTLWAAPRAVDDLPIALDLPDDWIPIPRAEIVEATERARSAGAASDWQIRAAWQRVPHLRWFTLPHLLLESQPSTEDSGRRVRVEHVVGRSGPRSVYTHRALWSRDQLALRLTLLSWEDERSTFEGWLGALRDGGRPLQIVR